MPNPIKNPDFDAACTALQELAKQQKSVAAQGQKALETILNDKSIPLGDRWELFCDAPTEFKNNRDCFEGRHRATKNVLEREVEHLGRNYPYSGEHLGRDLYNQEEPNATLWWDETLYARDVLEEILARNVGTFLL